MHEPDQEKQDWTGRLAPVRGELAERMHILVVAASADQITATMPVIGNRQPAGLLHGGANGVLAETLGSLHALVLAPDGYAPVGIELNCTHHRSATTGVVTGVSVPLNVGRTLAAFAITITDDRGRRICSARLTCMFLAQPAGADQQPGRISEPTD